MSSDNGSSKSIPSLSSDFMHLCPTEFNGGLDKEDFLLLEEWSQKGEEALRP